MNEENCYDFSNLNNDTQITQIDNQLSKLAIGQENNPFGEPFNQMGGMNDIIEPSHPKVIQKIQFVP